MQKLIFFTQQHHYVKLNYVEVLYFYYIIELTLMYVCMQHASVQKVTT